MFYSKPDGSPCHVSSPPAADFLSHSEEKSQDLTVPRKTRYDHTPRIFQVLSSRPLPALTLLQRPPQMLQGVKNCPSSETALALPVPRSLTICHRTALLRCDPSLTLIWVRWAEGASPCLYLISVSSASYYWMQSFGYLERKLTP